MAWLSSPDATHGVYVTFYSESIEAIWVGSPLSGYVKWTRTRTVTTTKYAGLTSAAADSQVTTSAAISGCTDAHKEPIGAGGWNVLETVETVTDYAPPS
jgi:hypothetical protein